MPEGTTVIIPNTPSDGDDPNNRFDCDYCAYCPTADELIQLVLNADWTIHSKFCDEHFIDAVDEHLATWPQITLQLGNED